MTWIGAVVVGGAQLIVQVAGDPPLVDVSVEAPLVDGDVELASVVRMAVTARSTHAGIGLDDHQVRVLIGVLSKAIGVRAAALDASS